MKRENRDILRSRLTMIYKDKAVVCEALNKLEERFSDYTECDERTVQLTAKDSVLITYGDSLYDKGKKGLKVLDEFLKEYVGDAFDTIHILPMYPYTTDDGFSVVDYMEINPDLGTWKEIELLSGHKHLMFDAVINHISKSSEWFQKYLLCESPYIDFFITADPNGDYRKVIRPRALPLLTKFHTKEGEKYVWTTFSEDQIDLNYKNPEVLVSVSDILIQYAKRGAKFIRLDAIGFLWKELGTSCMHLPEAHEVIKLSRKVLEIYAPGTFLITETNVPHKENISYFGNGFDEAHLVYQFPLPPLVMYSLLKGSARILSQWAGSLVLPSEQTTFFNLLSSHDGIGVRPVTDILSMEDQKYLVDCTLKNGGIVSYKDNGDGTKSPYELNINYQDALSSPEESDEIRIKKFIIAETILLSLQGVPAIYIHSLLGSRNDYYGRSVSEVPRRINREKLDYGVLKGQLHGKTNRSMIFHELIRRLQIRKKQSAFSPNASMEVFILDDRVFSIIRRDKQKGQTIHVFINVSTQTVTVPRKGVKGVDLIQGREICDQVTLEGLEAVWILEHNQ